jgi:hypothetical protein
LERIMLKRFSSFVGLLILGLTLVACARGTAEQTPTPAASLPSPVATVAEAAQTAVETPAPLPTATAVSQPTSAEPTPTVEIFVRSGRLTGATDVRLDPDQSAAVLGQLPQDAAVIVTGIQGDWYEMIYGGGPGGHGWVPQDVVSFELATATPVPSPTATAVAPTPETAAAASSQPTAQRPAVAAPKPSASQLAGTLVFQTQNGGTIYIMKADGTGLRKLTTGFEPALSPDGAQVAFTRWDEPRGLWLINTDGSNERFVYGANRTRSPTWTNDGQAVVVERSIRGRDCLLVPYAGCIPAEQLQMMLGGDCGELGPLGNVCLGDFSQVTLYDTALTSVDLATGETRDLPASETAMAPSQSPSESTVLYVDKDGLAATRNQGNEPPVRLVQAPNLLAAAQYSPDGRLIFGSRKSHDHWDIWRWLADGSQATALTAPPALRDRPINSVAPAVSPDGRSVAFLTDRTGQWELWVMNADGSNQRPLAPDAVAGIDFSYAAVNERMIDWGQ